ncbi:hypothetical protein [Hirschia maritima]|uniref:hypothetical protein n=1 Tax=Hirschia maritima TaxID=1121961 RepID=UPI00037F5CDF|nr:hypothetical protein [Hirschia maritima]
MQMLEKQLFRALWSGSMLFMLILLGCALSVALMSYYNQYELGLIFPVIGVLCMFFGEKLLRAMEVAGGQDPGGAGSTLIRSIVVAVVVITIPTLCWGIVMSLAEWILHGMEWGNLPRDTSDLSLAFRA